MAEVPTKDGICPAQIHDWLETTGVIGKKANNSSYVKAYKTTNDVFVGRDLILKKYSSRQGFLTERFVLDKSSKLSFRIPTQVASLDCEELGMWVVMEKIHGADLLSANLDDEGARSIGATIVRSLAEFEEWFGSNPVPNSETWGWSNFPGMLDQSLQGAGASELSNHIVTAAERADLLLSYLPKANCMDIFFRNIILQTGTSGSVSVGFIDFDKSWRLIPIGEQLSHLSQISEFLPHKAEFSEIYCKARGIDTFELNLILQVAPFFRAISGIRDSFLVLQENTEAGLALDLAEARWISFEAAVANASSFVSDAFQALGLPRSAAKEVKFELTRLRAFFDPEPKC